MKKPKKLPKIVKVLGKPFKVEQHGPEDMDGNEGDCCKMTSTIRISSERTLEQQIDILNHEIFHAWLGLTGLSELLTKKQEEALCEAFELFALGLPEIYEEIYK